MKLAVSVAVLLIAAGCASFYSQNIGDIVRTGDDLTLEKIVKRSSVISTPELIAGGESSYYVEFGADSCLVAEMGRRSGRYTVEIISFLTPKGALGAFNDAPLPGGYPSDVGDKALKSDTLFQFVKGAAIVTVEPIGDAGMAGAEALSLAIAGRMKSPSISTDIYSALPRAGIVEGSEYFFMGKRAFAKRYPPELAADLNIENIKEGSAAKYRTDDGDVDFIKVRYYKAEFAKDAVNVFLRNRSDMPVLLPRDSLQFYTVIRPDHTESYIADYAEWVYVMPVSPPGGKGKALFEYFLRGGR